MLITQKPTTTIRHHPIAGDLHTSNAPVPDKISANTPHADKNRATERSEKREPFPGLSPQINAKVAAMPPASVEVSSDKLSALHEKIAQLEKQVATLGTAHTTGTTTVQHASHAAPPSSTTTKLKKMAGSIKTAFANAPWEKIGKGALYAAAGVAAFALLSNPLGVLGMVGMVMGSSLLPTALGLAGAGAAVYQVHKWLGKKSDQAGDSATATTGRHGNDSFSHSLGNPA